ncbi:LLM class flavin-dependent oxidoreductase [Streptomyces sulphureus]|uniref:LLM class flavin-dependent oxidoreductase n=1 Tax=Streptomyces sulphureus TaxID=47758 RepID=UPI00035FF486|nr:LLM class flavin-dependent oxidoreductase [Streptomyces sulphureus]
MPTLSVQAKPDDAASWTALARRVEATGYAALLAADHPGAVASPFVALAAAAPVTERIALGTNVAQAGVREPLLLASDVATLDVVSGGRARLGLGAGHTPAEWRMLGRERPGAAARVRRLIAVAEACRTLLDGGEVTAYGPGLEAFGARLTVPEPVRRPIPLAVGGGNAALLRWAGEHADIVALTGLGRTLADGYSHEVRWSGAQIDRQVALIEEASARRETPPEREALVQHAEVTDDAERAAHALADRIGATAAEILASPYVWLGTVDEIAAATAAHARRWGITRYVVREEHLDAADRLLAHLNKPCSEKS